VGDIVVANRVEALESGEIFAALEPKAYRERLFVVSFPLIVL